MLVQLFNNNGRYDCLPIPPLWWDLFLKQGREPAFPGIKKPGRTER